MSKENCAFCSPKPKEYLTLAGLEPSAHARPLLESTNLIVFPDLMPVSDKFHLLITTKDHKHAFATDPDLNGELRGVLSAIRQKTQTNLLVIEHGGVDGVFSQTSTIQSIHHRHLHVLPAESGSAASISTKLFNLGIIHRLLEVSDPSPLATVELINLAAEPAGYLYLHMPSNGIAILAPDRNNSFPSQITQSTLSMLFNGEVLNWKNMENDRTLQEKSAARIAHTIHLLAGQVI